MPTLFWVEELDCGCEASKSESERGALLSLAFKPNTHDVREASSLKIAKALFEAEAHVNVREIILCRSKEEYLRCAAD